MTSAYAMRDSITMLRRNLLHLRRYPGLSLFPIFIGVAGALGRRMNMQTAMKSGAVVTILGMAFLAWAAAAQSLALLLLATATAGAGYGLQVVGGLAFVGRRISSPQRSSFMSAVLLVAYFSMGAVALAIGAIATEWGLRIGTYLGSACIALLSIVTIALTHRFFRRHAVTGLD